MYIFKYIFYFWVIMFSTSNIFAVSKYFTSFKEPKTFVESIVISKKMNDVFFMNILFDRFSSYSSDPSPDKTTHVRVIDSIVFDNGDQVSGNDGKCRCGDSTSYSFWESHIDVFSPIWFLAVIIGVFISFPLSYGIIFSFHYLIYFTNAKLRCGVENDSNDKTKETT